MARNMTLDVKTVRRKLGVEKHSVGTKGDTFDGTGAGLIGYNDTFGKLATLPKYIVIFQFSTTGLINYSDSV